MLLLPLMPFFGRAAPMATAVSLIVLATLASGCGEDLARARPAASPGAPYTPQDAELFDDGVEARALGYEIADSTGKDDRLLGSRVEASDAVVRARVVTVTSKAEDSGTGLQLSLHTLESLSGRRPPTGDFTLLASSKSPAAGVLKAAESRLVGLTFVAFVRSFASDSDDPEAVLHFHLAPDDPREQERVKAASLGPLR